MKRYLIAFAIFVAALPLQQTLGQSILNPTSVTSSGDFDNDISLIFDSFVPDRGTVFNSSTNVIWNDLDNPQFLFDYGTQVLVTDVFIAADNNDDYLVESSLDGINFNVAFEFFSSDGPLSAAAGGLDLLTTDSSFPTDPSDSFTFSFVGRSFTDIQARFLRVSSTGGDFARAVGEFQAVTTVPEPPSSILLLLVGACHLARRSVRATQSSR